MDNPNEDDEVLLGENELDDADDVGSKTKDLEYGIITHLEEIDEEDENEAEEEIFEAKSAATWYSDEASIYSSSLDTIPPKKDPLLLEDEDGLHMCFKTIEMSDSNVGTHPLYNFPNFDDPGILNALDDYIPVEEEDPGGVQRYIELCRQFGCTCISSMRHALVSDLINLRYYSISPLSLKALCIVMETNTFVHKIDFTDTTFTAGMCLHISNMLYENFVVREINFTNSRMGPDGMFVLARSIAASLSLSTLLLRNNSIGDAGMVALCNELIFEENSSLEYLDVGYNHIGEGCCFALQNWFTNTTNLTHLQLAWNDLHSELCINMMVKGLLKNKSIEFLGMAWNGISGSFFAKGIAKYLRKTRKLSELDISYNLISGEDSLVIMKAVKRSKSLRKLYIGGNPIYEEHSGPFAEGIVDVKGPLEYVGMQHLWIPLEAKLAMDKFRLSGSNVTVEYEGILHNFVIMDPDRKYLAIRRANFCAEPPRKKPPKKPPKKLKKRLSHLMLELLEQEKIESYPKEKFLEQLAKLKLKKLDRNLLNYWMDLYPDIKSSAKFNCRELAQEYFNQYPTDPYPPPPPKPAKKGKKGKDKNKKKGKIQQPAIAPAEEAPPIEGAPQDEASPA